ncbi:molybdopterin molybdotransferase MoeA [Streptomyces sp. NPDC127098]|uniref:molybdopterin molybdotransferase MoeA n=1 Tax=Streptomyces sp. NPDC127098 TaxID=3347137 RepID=UPI003646413E
MGRGVRGRGRTGGGDVIDDFDDALALANGPAPAAVATPAEPPQGRKAAGRELPGWESARAIAHRAARPLPPRRLPIDLALGHTLAAPLTALTDLPAFDTSAMDGWAVAGPGPWRLTGAADVLAGAPRAEPLTDGQAVPIATGARIPSGATAVLRSEHGTVARGQLSGPNPEPGADVRPRGQECRTGTELLPARTTLTPAALGLAAAAGYDQLAVRPRPRAEVLVLGDELLFRGLPHDGRIRDALGPMTGPWLTALGAHTLVTRRLGDDAEALHEAISTSRADLIVTTGSTAAGPVDHLRAVLRRLDAQLLVSGVAVRPGHPMLLAELPGGVPLVGLPGNPLAAVSALLTLAAPLLCALADRPAPEEAWAELTDAVRGHPTDTRLVPVRRPAPGEARPLSYAGPAMLRGIAAASALAVIPPGGAEAHTRVRLLDLPHA